MARFISYAQNYEDVILWRALKHVEHGFYVDCGAYDPTNHSVTKAFYDRGWRGINIEPSPSLLQQFMAQRPRDANLSIALSDNCHGAHLYEVAETAISPLTGLSTLLPDVARQHIDAGFRVRKTAVPTRTLSAVLGEFAKGEIHFLKIDVEGTEDLVLRGADLAKFRPWVILIEATRPRSSEASAAWEASLLARGYDFVYFDGLNRFYVAQERSALSQQLAIPPNVFDDFIQLSQLEAAGQAERALEDFKQSSSWRLTAPLRYAATFYRTLRDNPRRVLAHAVSLLPGPESGRCTPPRGQAAIRFVLALNQRRGAGRLVPAWRSRLVAVLRSETITPPCRYAAQRFPRG